MSSRIGPPEIILEVFPRNESNGTRPFSKFHCKRVPQNIEAVGHV